MEEQATLDRLNLWHPPHEPLRELEQKKPPPRPEPLPDLLIYTEQPTDKGTPEVVAKRLKDMREERERIAKMWHAEGKTRTYIPNTPEARKMKLQAKLQNRAEAKHAEIVRVEVAKRVEPIQIPDNAVVANAVELE